MKPVTGVLIVRLLVTKLVDEVAGRSFCSERSSWWAGLAGLATKKSRPGLGLWASVWWASVWGVGYGVVQWGVWVWGGAMGT